MDATISDVIITLGGKSKIKFSEAVNELKKAGVSVDNVDDENSVVEGTVDVQKIRDLEKLDCVDYVRTVFTYDADFPAGDPRDTNRN
jgi:hypothetical protein